MRAVSVSQHQCPAGLDGRGPAVVDVGGGVQAEAAVAVLVVVPGEEDRQRARAASIESKRRGSPAGT